MECFLIFTIYEVFITAVVSTLLLYHIYRRLFLLFFLRLISGGVVRIQSVISWCTGFLVHRSMFILLIVRHSRINNVRYSPPLQKKLCGTRLYLFIFPYYFLTVCSFFLCTCSHHVPFSYLLAFCVSWPHHLSYCSMLRLRFVSLSFVCDHRYVMTC